MKKHPVGAHYGLLDWLAQRMTAIVMVVATMIFVVAFYAAAPEGYGEWKRFITLPAMRVLLLIFVLSLVWHAFIGVRDIHMDYLKNNALRLFKITGTVVYLLACLLWAMTILL